METNKKEGTMDKEMTIEESDFIRAEDNRLRELAEYIKRSGLSIYDIAKGCRMSWRTVRNAAQCLPVHGSTESRIRFYIETRRKEKC